MISDEIKEKTLNNRKSVSMILKEIPMPVHRKIIQYNRKLSASRGKDFNLAAAYVEFLKEYTRNLAV
jgi:hypothetical protein